MVFFAIAVIFVASTKLQMINIQQDIDLLPFNTFHLHATARYFTVVRSVDDVRALIQTELFNNHHRLVLGGGSNMLLTKPFEGIVIKNEIKGISVKAETDDVIVLEVGAGEGWHDFVMYCVDKNFGGIENLSLIPGTMGAAPMQNIGAYGVEIKDTIVSVQAVDLSDGALRVFTNAECKFSYRESIFKHEAKDRYFISSVTLSLTKRNHKINTSYGAIQEVLQAKGLQPTIKNISDAVIHIRRSKLPDPSEIGNAGSFFKNPSVEQHVFDAIRQKYPTAPSFPSDNNLVKVPAGWLIEQCGWKGKTFNNIGVHKNQALVLVNYGGGKGSDIWKLALEIQRSVSDQFNITLQTEVNII